jgi:hypothetical protein
MVSIDSCDFGQTRPAMVKPLREAAERLIRYLPEHREYWFANRVTFPRPLNRLVTQSRCKLREYQHQSSHSPKTHNQQLKTTLPRRGGMSRRRPSPIAKQGQLMR